MRHSENRPSPVALAQRIRNRIIEYLQTASSFDKQLDYERNVPIADVPGEMIGGWEDYVAKGNLDYFREPVFSGPEQKAIRDFQAIWESVVKDAPDELPALADLIKTELWERLRAGAARALTVFDLRGKFDENREISDR